MKKLSLIVIGLFIATTLFAQDCKLNGNYSSLLSELKNRNTNSGDQKFTNEQLGKIANYWVADCKCRKGVSSEAEARELYNEAFRNKSPNKGYKNGSYFEKDMSCFGDLEPPFAVFTANSCLQGGSTNAMSLGDATNCAPEASRLSSLDGNLGAYAGQFFVAYCACKKGVSSKEEADVLINTMKANYNSFNETRNATTGALRTEPLTTCDITPGEGSQSVSYSKSGVPPKNLKETFIKEFNPQGYGYYQYSKGIAEQGKRITEGLSNQLNSYSKLIESSNPEVLLADFNQKMTNIENLEQSYIQESFNFGQQRGKELANQINSGDHLGALTNAVNTISTISDMNKADREIAEKKEKLRKQQIQQMSNVYWKAIEANDKMIDNYMKRAAYAESIQDEEYNLAFVENLKCYAKRMDANWSATSSSWLNNTCPKPTKPDGSTVENLLIDADIQMKNIAQRKLKLYERTAESIFLDGAISYAAAAINMNPTAENFYFLGQLYRRNSMMLAYANLLAAKETDGSFFDDSKNEILDLVKNGATVEVANAIQENNTEYLKSFLTVGLDRTILINNRDLLTEAIRIDNPDAVQVILNEYVRELSSEERSEKVKKTIMLCAAQNSIKTLERFQELKINTDFQMKGYTPVQIAAEANATDAYSLLSGNKQLTTRNEDFSSVELLLKAEKNPKEVANTIDKTVNKPLAKTLTTQMVEDLSDKPFYIDVLANCHECISHANANVELQKILKSIFADEVLIPSPKSDAHKYIRSGLITFNKIPTYDELFEEAGSNGIGNVKSSLIDLRLSLHDLILASYDKAFEAGFPKNSYDRFRKYHTNRFKVLNEFKYQDLPVSMVEERKIAANIYLEYENLSVSGTKLENIAYNQFRPYVLSRYNLKENISLEFKMNKIRKTLSRSNLNPNEQWEFKSFQTLDKSIEQWGADHTKEQGINKIYIYCALLEGYPLDKALFEYMFDDNLTIEEYNNRPRTESIIFMAFDYDNFELFSALDEQFDLSGMKNQNDILLSDYIINGSKAISNKEYYSMDLNINKSKETLYRQLSKQVNQSVSLDGFFNLSQKQSNENGLIEILKIYGLGLNDKFSKTGGTILHWVVDDALEQAKQGAYEADNYAQILEMKVDRLAKDNNGNTAYDYLKSLKSKFKKVKSSGNKTGNLMYQSLELLLKQ